jgi:putative heme-binding domain-containing protein
MRYTLSFSLFMLLSAPLLAQRDAKIPDPDPELERKTFIVPEGFEVNLFAADPLLAKPIQMNFDPQGRLWIAASEVYPQIKPGEKASDKVLILEDTNNDGKADKTTIFADGLLIPTGVAPGDGGAYVADSTELVHFSDPDPVTGKARKKRVVLSGFGTEDTHHILHTLRWAHDGMLYMSQSIYIHSHIETPHGVKRLNAGGVWQFRPETLNLNVYARGFVNTWGTQFDRWGQSFATDGAYGEGINILMPGAYYFTASGATRILQGLNPGSPKHCGLAILSGRHLPEEYRGNMVTNDFRGHRVCRFVLKEDGSGYQSQEKQEIIKSNHPAFRPIDVAMGPDGAIYVADWYNPIIQHGEVDFRDPRRDKTHGRIWRISAKNRPLVEKPKLVGASVKDLLEALKAPEDFTRQMAKQVLKERGAAAVLPELTAWLASLKTDDANYEHNRLEALWLYQTMNVVQPKLLEAVLNSPDHHARAAACRVVAAWAAELPNALNLLAPRVLDEHPQVRLDAVRALAQIPSPQAAQVAAQALDKPVDKWLDYGLWLLFRELAPQWLPAVQAGEVDFNGNPRHLVFALQASGSGDVVQPLKKLIASKKIATEKLPDVYTLLAQLGGPNELGEALRFANTVGMPARVKIFTAIEDSARTRKVGVPPDRSADSLYFALDQETGPSRQSAARLSGLWKLESCRPMLEKIALKANLKAEVSSEDRVAAFEGLVSLGGPKTRQFLDDAIKSGSPDAKPLAVVALANMDLNSGAIKAVEFLTSAPATPEIQDVFSVFINRKNGSVVLTKALTGKKLPPEVAKLGLKAAKQTAQPDQALIAILNKVGGLSEARLKLSGDALKSFLNEVATKGDPARGEVIYRKAEMNCLKCHAIAGAGGLVGPDMTSIGASAQPDYLIESLLEPNAKIKEGYNSFVITTVDDRIFTGVKIRENKDELLLRDAEGKEVAIPVGDIASRKDGKSLMPEGLVDTLTRQELVDLTRFLSELGKGPYLASAGKVVRQWQVLQPNPAMFTILNRQRLAAVSSPESVGLNWQPAYSQVSGELPVEAAPSFRAGMSAGTAAVVRFPLEVTATGPIKLKFNETKGLTAWLNGVPFDLTKEVTLEVANGVQTITIAIDTKTRTTGLKVELDEVPGSKTRARLIGK